MTKRNQQAVQQNRQNKKVETGRVLKEKFEHERNPPPIHAKTEKQREYFRMLRDPNIQCVVVLGLHGTGKAQPLYSKISTPNGWINMGDVKVGDIVHSVNGDTFVTGVFPQGEKEVVRFNFKDGTFVDSCVDHIWTVDSNASFDGSLFKKKRTNLKTSDIVELLNNKVSGNISVPLISPVNYVEKDVAVDPYLLGVLIGDGCLRGTSVTFSSADKEIVESVSSIIPDTLSVKSRAGYDYAIVRSANSGENELITELKKLEIFGKLSKNKFIPSDYIFNSVDVRYSLLQGLMDADGTVDARNGNVSYCTTSEQLANDVRGIVLSLGGKSSISVSEKYFTHNGEKKKGCTAYIVSINVPDKTKLFRLKRKLELVSTTQVRQLSRNIDSYELLGKIECQCISVDDESRLYLTDDYIPTHNTFCASVVAADAYRRNEVEEIVVARPYVQTGRTSGFKPGNSFEKLYPYVRNVLDTIKARIGEGAYMNALKDGQSGAIQVQEVESIRGRSFDRKGFLIIDEAQQTLPDEMKSIVTRISDSTKLVLCGDENQRDIKGESGLKWFLDFAERHELKGVGIINFNEPSDIVRGGFVRDVAIGLMKDGEIK